MRAFFDHLLTTGLIMNIFLLRRALTPAVAAFLLLLASAASATQDRIELVNGSVIIGSFLDADSGTVTIETDFAGVLSIAQERIASMSVGAALTLQLEDGSVLETDSLLVQEQTLTLEEQAHTSYALAQLTRINPEPWELGVGYQYSGTASSAVSLQRGNTERDELDYRLDTRWTGLGDRYTLKVEGEVREANGERNSENWLASASYDRFQTNHYYWGMAASAEENRFADLDLRTSVGPYLGRNLVDSSALQLELETGLSQVREDYGEATDRNYLGLTWTLRSETESLGSNSRVYLDHSGVKNLAESDNLILNTTVGMAFPLIGRVQGAAEVVLDYNSGAVAGTEELDQTYRFRLGYNW